jgi:hypothetical protein
MFLGLANSHPDPLITSTDPDDPDPDVSLYDKSVQRTEIMIAK